MSKLIDKYPVPLLIIIGLGLYAFNLGELQVSIMEARNFVVAREMITENNWLLTTMNTLPRYEKPPFPAWFTTPFAYIFGVNNVWAYRIPTSIFSILGIVYFFKLINTWLSKDIAFYAALILATSFYYIVIRFEAPSDIYTHVSMIIALYFLMRHPQISFNNVFLGGLFLGFSILSKGPVSLYALFSPFFLAYIFTFKVQIKSFLLWVLTFLIIGLLVGGSWYIYVRYADPNTIVEIASEEAGNWTSYHVKPFYYYWNFFIQSGIWTIPAFLSLFYPYFKNRIKQKQLYKFSFLWTILAVVLLSVIPEKKPRYLVPVLFPLAIITSLVINYFIHNKQDRFSKLFHYVHYSVIMIACIVVVIAPFILDLQLTWKFMLLVLLSIFSLYVCYFTFKALKYKNFKSLFWSNIVFILLITSLGQARIEYLKKNKDYKALGINGIGKKKIPTYYYKNLPPEVIWEYGKTVPKFSSDRIPELPFRLLISENNLKTFISKHPGLLNLSKKEVFDRNYFRKGEKRHTRFITHVYEIVNKKR